jgi:O-antigen/teichoic acid export membrane protein
VKDFRRFLARPFLRNVVTMAGGAAGAQAITMVFAPIVTRLYGPEAFGVQGMFLSLVSILATVAALAYPIAIVLPSNASEARALMRLSMLVSVLIATGLTFVLMGLSGPIVEVLHYQAIEPFLFVLPLVVVLSAWLQVTEQWLIRQERFSALACVSIIQSLVVNVARAGLGLVSATASMLVAVTTLGFALNVGMNAAAGRKVDSSDRQGPVEKVSLARMAVEHRDFPFYRAPEMLLGAVSASLPILVLAGAFGPATAGFYALARSVLYLPVSLVGNSVAQVFYPRFNRQMQAGAPLLPLFLQAIGGLALIGLPIFITIAVLGPWAFSLAFGGEWVQAGHYARWLSLWLFFMLVNRPCIGVTSVLGMQRSFLVQGVLALALRFGGLWIGWRIFANDLWAVALFSAGGGIAAVLLVGLVAYRISRMENSRAGA